MSRHVDWEGELSRLVMVMQSCIRWCTSCKSQVFIAILVITVTSAAAQTTRTYPLGKVEVTPLKWLTQLQVLGLGELSIGQRIDPAVIEAAAERLLATGLFGKVSYEYRFNSGQIELMLRLEEKPRDIPVVFDNFVWFSDDEMVAAVAEKVPAFDGVAPDSGPVVDRIGQALDSLLKKRGIVGQVDYLPEYSLKSREKKHIYLVRDSGLTICALEFPGASGVSEPQLIEASNPLFGEAYSRNFAFDYANQSLSPLYWQRGYLRVRFRVPVARPDSSPNCSRGVAVTIPVEEGISYALSRVDWVGQQAISAEELNSLLSMKSGEVANGLKIDAGLKLIATTYGKQGYIEASFTPEQIFDDPGRLVTYRMLVREGPQYRMGRIEFRGLSESDAASLKRKWKLQPGDVFDASYIGDFTKSSEFLRIRQKTRAKNVELAITPERRQLIVDVAVTLKQE